MIRNPALIFYIFVFLIPDSRKDCKELSEPQAEIYNFLHFCFVNLILLCDKNSKLVSYPTKQDSTLDF